MKHSRLTKLLKVNKQKGNDLLETEDKITEKADNGNHDFTDLLAAYLKLTQTVQQQKKTINDLANRVNYLEIKAGQKLEQERQSNDVESAEDNGKPSKSIRQSQESKKNTIQVEAEVHCDSEGVKQMPPRIQNESSFEANSMTTEGSFKGNFRHSSKERKNILKKPKVVNKVKAAPFLDRKSSTYLLYVGNVAIETNEKAIRDHLCDIGVKCERYCRYTGA